MAGQVTSAAELQLANGSRKFALGMIRGEAEVKSQPMEYSVEGVVGTARLLADPPRL